MRRHWSVVIVQWAEEAAVSGRKHSRKVKWLLQRRPSPTGNRCLRQLLRDLYRLEFILFCVWYLWPTAMTVLTRATKVSNNNGRDYCRCMDEQSVARAPFLSHRISSLFRNVVENLQFWRQLTPAFIPSSSIHRVLLEAVEPLIPSLLLRDEADGAWGRPLISSQFPGCEWVELYFHSPYMPSENVQWLLKLYFTLPILSIAKAVEGRGPRPTGTDLLSWNFPWQNERNYKKNSQNKLCSGHNSNHAPPEYKSEVLQPEPNC